MNTNKATNKDNIETNENEVVGKQFQGDTTAKPLTLREFRVYVEDFFFCFGGAKGGNEPTVSITAKKLLKGMEIAYFLYLDRCQERVLLAALARNFGVSDLYLVGLTSAGHADPTSSFLFNRWCLQQSTDTKRPLAMVNGYMLLIILIFLKKNI